MLATLCCNGFSALRALDERVQTALHLTVPSPQSMTAVPPQNWFPNSAVTYIPVAGRVDGHLAMLKQQWHACICACELGALTKRRHVTTFGADWCREANVLTVILRKSIYTGLQHTQSTSVTLVVCYEVFGALVAAAATLSGELVAQQPDSGAEHPAMQHSCSAHQSHSQLHCFSALQLKPLRSAPTLSASQPVPQGDHQEPFHPGRQRPLLT